MLYYFRDTFELLVEIDVKPDCLQLLTFCLLCLQYGTIIFSNQSSNVTWSNHPELVLLYLHCFSPPSNHPGYRCPDLYTVYTGIMWPVAVPLNTIEADDFEAFRISSVLLEPRLDIILFAPGSSVRCVSS